MDIPVDQMLQAAAAVSVGVVAAVVLVSAPASPAQLSAPGGVHSAAPAGTSQHQRAKPTLPAAPGSLPAVPGALKAVPPGHRALAADPPGHHAHADPPGQHPSTDALRARASVGP